MSMTINSACGKLAGVGFFHSKNRFSGKIVVILPRLKKI
jgi:hypothetical protein